MAPRTVLLKAKGPKLLCKAVLLESIYYVEMSLKSCCQTRGHCLTRSAARGAPVMSGWVCAGLFMDAVKGSVCLGTRVRGEQRVITLHPVAPGCFTKPDTGGQEEVEGGG